MPPRSCCSLLLVLAACAAPGAPSPRPDVAWDQQPGALALRVGGEERWRFQCGAERSKPCFHPLALPGGRVLTLDAPGDHRWHHGLWFSWKLIDGVNYWENDSKTGRPAGRTAWTVDAIEPRPDGSARFVLQLAYGPESAPVLRERRVLEVGAPAADGAFAIDWDCAFTAERACVLGRTPMPGEPGGRPNGGYAGLSVRLVDLADRQAATSEGPATWNEHERCRARAGAFDYSGVLAGEEVGVAVLAHPANRNAPSPWYAVRSKAMTFANAAVLAPAELALQPGERFTLRYRVWVHPGRWDAVRLQVALADYVPAASR